MKVAWVLNQRRPLRAFQIQAGHRPITSPVAAVRAAIVTEHMSEMKITSMALAICALFAGLLAAWYWYKSSVVKLVPKTDGRFGGGMATAPAPWVAGAIDAFAEAARLNKNASLWTAATVVLAALSSVAGTLISN